MKTRVSRQFDRALGRRIELTRAAVEMKAKDLAASAGLTPGQLYNYESGIRSCPPSILARIAETLGVSVTALMPKYTNCGEAVVISKKSLTLG